MADYSYDEILNRSWDDIADPETLPVGDWHLVGDNASFIESKDEKQSDKIVFFWKVVAPVDVPQEELDKLGADYDLDLNRPNQTFYIDGPLALSRVRKFLSRLGIDLSGKGFKEGLDAFRGAEAVALLDQRSYVDQSGETNWQNDVKKVRAFEG